jgi:hypothetical protein
VTAGRAIRGTSPTADATRRTATARPKAGRPTAIRDGHRDGYYSRLEIPEPSMRELIDRTRALQRKNADTLKHMQKVRDEITADYAAEQRRQAQYDNDGKRRDGQ